MTRTANDLVAHALTRIQQLSPHELAECRGTSYLLIDVREPAEVADAHLPGAINLPRGVLEFKIEAHPALACQASPELADRQRPLVVYCLTGGRSALAADSLQELGFSDVLSLEGGITAWRAAALPVVSGSGA